MPLNKETVEILDRAAEQLALVQEDLASEKSARKVTIVVCSLVFVFLFAVCFSLYQVSADLKQQIIDSQIQACEARNEGRLNTVESFGFLIEVAQANSEEPTTPETQATTDAFLEGLAERFPQVDCEAR